MTCGTLLSLSYITFFFLLMSLFLSPYPHHPLPSPIKTRYIIPPLPPSSTARIIASTVLSAPSTTASEEASVKHPTRSYGGARAQHGATHGARRQT